MRFWIPFYAITGSLTLGLFVARQIRDSRPQPVATIQQEFIACMSHGCVYCGAFEQVACGVNITKCSDARDYLCTHDVTIKVTP